MKLNVAKVIGLPEKLTFEEKRGSKRKKFFDGHDG